MHIHTLIKYKPDPSPPLPLSRLRANAGSDQKFEFMGVFRFSSWYVLFEGPNEKLGSPKSFLPKCPPSGNIGKQRNP